VLLQPESLLAWNVHEPMLGFHNEVPSQVT
jgi:hypothetical protein